MQVVKITPKELTSDFIFRLNHLYHAELGEFVVMADNRKEILYVNKKVSKKDIDGFLEVIMFPEYAVADDDAPTGQFLDYVYHKYGFHTYMALMDAHSWRMEQKEQARAEEAAKAIIPLIEKEVNSENPIVEYDELLNFEIWKHGFHLDKSTPKNTTNYGSVYEFYFGYLMGAGKLEKATDMSARYITETERMMRQIGDVEALKKIYTTARTLLDIRREKGGAT